jgi:hypothetical protein
MATYKLPKELASAEMSMRLLGHNPVDWHPIGLFWQARCSRCGKVLGASYTTRNPHPASLKLCDALNQRIPYKDTSK